MYTRHMTKKNKTQNTAQKTKKMSNWQHRVHNTKKNRETGNIGYTIRRNTKQNKNTICVGHHYTQANTNKVNKT